MYIRIKFKTKKQLEKYVGKKKVAFGSYKYCLTTLDIEDIAEKDITEDLKNYFTNFSQVPEVIRYQGRLIEKKCFTWKTPIKSSLVIVQNGLHKIV